MRFSLFEYFELNNTPFGQLVYCSVIRLSHFPKGYVSGKICVNLEIFNMVGWILSGPEILLRERRIGYFSDPVLIIKDPRALNGVAGFYIILPENSHKNLNCTKAKTTLKKNRNFTILFLEINNETTKNGI